jgi:hypothetical protein
MALKETQMPLMAKNNAKYKTVDGVTYFKLKSEFDGDYTKHCGLLGEEIDENFYFLRGYDIEDISIDENRNLIITRVDKDYEPIVVNIDEEIGHPSFSFNREQGIITVTYPDGSVTLLEGFPIEGHDIRIAVDSSLVGNGTMFNPLKLSPIEKTGTFAPVEEYIDCTINAGFIDENDVKLPEKERGYRILSKEIIDNFGYLYPLSAVKALDEYFKEQQSLWRVTTKEDWDNILNYYECPEHRNHDKTTCEWLGDRAGRAIKSGKYWINYDEQPTFGENTSELSVFPLGLVPDRNEILEEQNNDAEGFGKLTGIWTSTCGKDGNAYAKIFSYKSGLVKQDTYGAGAKMSIRLIRDWSIENQHHGIEEILGYPFSTVELCGADGRKYVMTDINFYVNDDKALQGVKSDEWNNVSGSDRGLKEVYFINESKGNGEWYKKLMENGDSVVINNHKGKNYHEWRVVDGVLVDTVDYIVNEFNKDFTVIKDDIDDLYSNIDIINKNATFVSGSVNTLSGATIDNINRIDSDVRFVSSSVVTFSAATIAEFEKVNNDIVTVNETVDVFSGATIAEIKKVNNDITTVNETIDAFSAATIAEIKNANNSTQYVNEVITTERDERISSDNYLQQQITENISRILSVTDGLDSNVQEEYVLENEKGEELGSHIKIYKNSKILSFLKGYEGAIEVKYDSNGDFYLTYPNNVNQKHEYLYLIYSNENGELDFIGYDLQEFVIKDEVGDGINITDNSISINIKNGEQYLQVTPDGLQTINIDNAIYNSTNVVNDKLSSLSAATIIETNRAINEEKRLQGLFETENTRATKEENRLQGLIDTEITNRKTEDADIRKEITSNKVISDDFVVNQTENGTNISIQVDGVTIAKQYNPDGAILHSLLKVVKVDTQDVSIKSCYELQGTDGKRIGDPIVLPVESALIGVKQGRKGDEIDADNGSYIVHGTGDTTMNFVYRLENGKYELMQVVVSDYFTDSHFGKGLNNQDGVISLLEGDGNEYLVIGEDTISVIGVDNAIAIAKNNAIGTASGYTEIRYNDSISYTNSRIEDVAANMRTAINNEVKNVIVTDGVPISIRPEDTVHSLMREVLTDSTPRFYASPFATDMFYVKDENTVTPISMNLNQYITALENRIIALEALLSGVNGTLEHMIKDTVKNYLVGTVQEIKIVPEINEEIETLRIGFDDNAIFGEMPQNDDMGDLEELPNEQDGF